MAYQWSEVDYFPSRNPSLSKSLHSHVATPKIPDSGLLFRNWVFFFFCVFKLLLLAASIYNLKIYKNLISKQTPGPLGNQKLCLWLGISKTFYMAIA